MVHVHHLCLACSLGIQKRLKDVGMGAKYPSNIYGSKVGMMA